MSLTRLMKFVHGVKSTALIQTVASQYITKAAALHTLAPRRMPNLFVTVGSQSCEFTLFKDSVIDWAKKGQDNKQIRGLVDELITRIRPCATIEEVIELLQSPSEQEKFKDLTLSHVLTYHQMKKGILSVEEILSYLPSSSTPILGIRNN